MTSLADRGPRAALGLLAAIACAAILAAAFASQAAAASPAGGAVRFVKKFNNTESDRFTQRPSAQRKAFFRSHYSGMIVSTPYFDSRLPYYPNAWAYRDLYAVPTAGGVARSHPSWILRQSRKGAKAYIPFYCSGGRCPQYAADLMNPSFRKAWIASARTLIRRGYKTLFIDDVNMITRVGTGTGRQIVPYSPYLKKRISQNRWRVGVARFTRQIRRGLPRTKLVHNVIWFAPAHKDKITRMQMRSADTIALERGVNDSGLTGGSGYFGVRNFLNYISFIHRLKRPVLLDESAPTAQSRNYGLAGYLMINTGRDMLSSDPFGEPDKFWRGYRVKLGAPTSGRYRWKGMLRRNFQNGVALFNEPSAPTRTVSPGGTFRRAGTAQRVTSVTLGAADGAVLVRAP